MKNECIENAQKGKKLEKCMNDKNTLYGHGSRYKIPSLRSTTLAGII